MHTRLEQDLADTEAWLMHKFGDRVFLMAAQESATKPGELTQVLVIDNVIRPLESLRDDALQALRALGWKIRIEESREPVVLTPYPIAESSHERLQAIGRINQALRDAEKKEAVEGP